jgi:hypothetical protein
MSEYVVNPRRAPRANARCRAAVVSTRGAFEAETEDLGAHGCQVISPRPIARGETLRLQIFNPGVPSPLHLSGRVAWVSPQAPWRLGIAFEVTAHEDAGRWFHALVESMGGVGPVRRIPDRIPVDATIYLGPPPRFLADFSEIEVTILRAIGSGVSVGELRARLKADWAAAGERAFFSLLARNHLTLSRGASVHPSTWRRIIDDIEGSLAVAAMSRSPTPVPLVRRGAAPPAKGAATPRTPPAASQPVAPPPPMARAESRAAARALDGGAAWHTPAGAPPPPDFTGAGVGWRHAQRPRPPEAQVCLELAMSEIASGRPAGGLALLRRALALAPGDPEIAAAIATLAHR